MDDTPTHLKFGYQHMLEMREIEDALLASGLSGTELYFAAIRQYEARHRNDPTYRQRQERWMATASTPAPKDLIRQALEQIRDGHNDPRTLAREVLEAVSI